MRGLKITVTGPLYSGKKIRATNLTRGLDLYLLPYRRSLIGQICYIKLLLGLLKTFECDIIHLHSHLFYFNAIPTLITAHKLKIPLVVTVHGVYSKINFIMDTLQKLYLRTFCRILWSKAALVICLTEDDAQEIAKYGCSRHKIAVVPNWVNTDLFKPSKHRDENFIFWPGRFVPTKGLEYLMKASKIVVKHYPDARFVLAGDGPLKSKIARLITNEGLSNNFELLGPVRYEQIAEQMSRASIFVFPSLKEGMPFSILEAMACGTAIAASDIPGINNIVKDNEHALLVKPRDYISLANAIIRLLDSKELRTRLGNNARKLAEELYTPEQITNKTIDLYESLIAKNSLLIVNDN